MATSPTLTKTVKLLIRCESDSKTGTQRYSIVSPSRTKEEDSESDLSFYEPSRPLRLAVHQSGISVPWKQLRGSRKARIIEIAHSSSGNMSLTQAPEQVEDSDFSPDEELNKRPSPTVVGKRERTRKGKPAERLIQITQKSGLYSCRYPQIEDSDFSSSGDEGTSEAVRAAIKRRPAKRQREQADQYQEGREYRNKFRKAVMTGGRNFQLPLVNANGQSVAPEVLAQLHGSMFGDLHSSMGSVGTTFINQPPPPQPASVPPIPGRAQSFEPAPLPNWFLEDSVSQLEISHFAKFFPMDEEKFVRLYFDIRNELIKLWRFKLKMRKEQEPSLDDVQLTAHEARLNMHAEDDAALVFEAWRWLTEMGIINRLAEENDPGEVPERPQFAPKPPFTLRHAELLERITSDPEVDWEELENHFENPVLDLLTMPLVVDSKPVELKLRKDEQTHVSSILSALKNSLPQLSESPPIFQIEEGRVRTGANAEVAVAGLYARPKAGNSGIYSLEDASKLLLEWLEGVKVAELAGIKMEVDGLLAPADSGTASVIAALAAGAAKGIEQEREKLSRILFEFGELVGRRLETKMDLIETLTKLETPDAGGLIGEHAELGKILNPLPKGSAKASVTSITSL